MKREHLEHILRSAGSITGLDKFIIIGSQAILASIKNPPIELTASKLIAGRPKDIDYVKNMLKYKIIFLKDLKKVSTEFSGKSKHIFENALKLL